MSAFDFPDSDKVNTSSSEYETALERQDEEAPSSRMPGSQLEAERDLLGMKLRMLERSVSKLTERGRSLKRRRRDYSDSKSSSSSSWSSSSSSSSDSRRSRSSKRRRKPDVPGWKTTSYAKQFVLNTELLDLPQAKKSKSKTRRRKSAKKGERLFKKRQEWLLIAEKHGHQMATPYLNGSQIMAVVGDSKMQKRLQAAIQAEGARKKAAGAVQGASMQDMNIPKAQGASLPLRQSSMPIQPMQGNLRAGVCHRCGQVGHYVSSCPPQHMNATRQMGLQTMQIFIH